MVPHRNDLRDENYNKLNHHGRLVRFDLASFGDFATIETLDLANVSRMQVPDIPDPLLRGFTGGFAAGNYTYLCPYFNKNYQGKLTRVDMRDFNLLVEAQRDGRSTSLQSPEFNSDFDGVQYVDLEVRFSEVKPRQCATGADSPLFARPSLAVVKQAFLSQRRCLPFACADVRRNPNRIFRGVSITKLGAEHQVQFPRRCERKRCPDQACGSCTSAPQRDFRTS